MQETSVLRQNQSQKRCAKAQKGRITSMLPKHQIHLHHLKRCMQDRNKLSQFQLVKQVVYQGVP